MSNWDKDPVLTVEHLTMRFGGLVAINDLSFNVGRGDITALIGPNGAGKTTVFNCVTGFYKPTEGRIVMRHGPGRQADEVEALTDSGQQWRKTGPGAVFLLERMPDFEISARAKVARTFQNIRLFGGMTVLENLLVAQHNPLMIASNFTIGGILGLGGYRKAEKDAVEKAVYWLEQVNLIDRADDPAGDLPYGAQRRLEIARAMCSGPHLLCLDEPAAGLNPRESAELNELLQYIRREHNTSILLIEHDMGVVMEISDHVIVLDYGQKISDGSADAVRNDPKVIAAYLGVDDEAEIEDEDIKADLASLDAAPASEPAKPVSAIAAMTAHAATGKMPASGVSDGTQPAAVAKPKAKAKQASAKTAKSAPPAEKKAKAPAAVKPAKPAATAAKAPEKATAKPASAKSAKAAAPAEKAAKPTAAAKPSKPVAAAKAPAKASKASNPAAAPAAAGEAQLPGAKPPVLAKAEGTADNLTRIKGVGPKNEAKLNELGIFHFRQIAAWKKKEAEWVGAYMAFPGRIEREEWIAQAKLLAKGKDTEFSKRVDAGKVATSRATGARKGGKA
ncbi:MAG: ATP-binding cassette domain-containing protein [Notoacmeibacter sp.]|nr:ATP-binding cassette domain-containing protein [Notoacmeibacter sp.]